MVPLRLQSPMATPLTGQRCNRESHAINLSSNDLDEDLPKMARRF